MSEAGARPELLVCFVKDHHHVEEILTGFLELDIKGATVLDGRGMGQILSTEVPIFAGFKSLFPGSTAGTYTILTVVDRELVDEAIRLVEEVCGALDRPGSGFVFTVPVSRVRGLGREP